MNGGVPWDDPNCTAEDIMADIQAIRDHAADQGYAQIVVPPPITEIVKRVYGPDWRDCFDDNWYFVEWKDQR